MKVLQALVEYVVRSGAFILPEDPSRPGEHDWKATPITKMESTVQYGKHVIRKEFPEKIQAWGQEIPKAECALVYGTAVSYSGEAPNKRAYLVRAMLSSQGVVAVPLAMFVLGPNGWFLSSQTAPPRLGVETASTQRAANIANGIR
ncbi:MAG: hypothetical protein NZ741_13295, partial [Armatimonadetes bacterium]|nr:hypothetical protein [Armatimonadota bacterium]